MTTDAGSNPVGDANHTVIFQRLSVLHPKKLPESCPRHILGSTMKNAIIALAVLAITTCDLNADVKRLDVPRSLDGERVVEWNVAATREAPRYAPRDARRAGAGDSSARRSTTQIAATLYAPRVISADKYTQMIGVNGTWSETLPECYAGVLPIQPMPDEPTKSPVVGHSGVVLVGGCGGCRKGPKR